MPGMMDTVLNLGLNDEVVEGLAKKRGERFAFDCYRRLLDMFGDVVLNIEHEKFEEQIHAVKEENGLKLDVELTGTHLREVVRRFKGVYEKEGKSLPNDPYEQMRLAINAVFGSWNTPRAVKYREINRIRGLLGTAVNVQSMVYGNLNDNSGTGVCFTRNPATGEKKLYGEYLQNAQVRSYIQLCMAMLAGRGSGSSWVGELCRSPTPFSCSLLAAHGPTQGEDVVAGIRTPKDVSHVS
jgi:pyruvate,orthophosphate dikinase